TKPEVPIVCTDKYRTYLWVTLGKDGALPPTDDALRINSSRDETTPRPPKQERNTDAISKHPASTGQTNGRTPPSADNDNGHTTNGAGLGALIAEAQALKEALHDGYIRSARL